MKILTIGDIHGRANWWKIVSPVINQYDYIVFTADYVDSFHIRSEKIIYNLHKIIKFKKDYPDKVILLWGNHDIQYLSDFYNIKCTGHRDDYGHILNDIFTTNKKLFQFAFQIENYLWTHAGINNVWYNKFNNMLIDLNIDNNINLLAENLNMMYNSSYFKILNTVGTVRGGLYDETGDILWSDINENMLYPVKLPIHQIVGHNPTDNISRSDTSYNGSYTYVDVSYRVKMGYSLYLDDLFKMKSKKIL